MVSILIGALAIALTFGTAVFVHEFGHFIFARIRGVGVEAFAIGMGPKIFAWTHKGTEYSLRWLPIGGFVKLHQMVREEAEDEGREEKLSAMAEEEEGKTLPGPNGEAAQTAAMPPNDSAAAANPKPKSLGQMAHEDMAALYDKGFLTKLMVFGGGVFFNLLTAIGATAFLYSIGFDLPKPPPAWVGDVAEKTPLWEAGLRQGDYVVEIEGQAVANTDDVADQMHKAAATQKGKDGLDIKVRRGEEIASIKLPPLADDSAVGSYFTSFNWDFKPVIGGVIPFQPAAKAGLMEGDLIVGVNDKPVNRWSVLSKTIRNSPNEAISLAVKRRGFEEPIKVSLVPKEDPMQPGTGIIGIQSGGAEEHEWIQEPALVAIAHAPIRTLNNLVYLGMVNWKALTEVTHKSGVKGLKQSLGGPVAIAAMTQKQAEKGFRYSLNWFITLNLILMIMNLLPIPVLDGGFILLSFIEAVVRRPVPTRVLNPVYTVFVLGFLSLFIFVTYNDVLNILF